MLENGEYENCRLFQKMILIYVKNVFLCVKGNNKNRIEDERTKEEKTKTATRERRVLN